jgi:MFS family permease
VTGTAALVGALISPLAGPLGDRVGFRRVLIVTLLAAGAALLAMPIASSVGVLAVIAVVYAAMQAATQAMVFGLVAVEVAPERRSATLNLVLLPLYVAGIIGPTLGAGAAGIGGVPATYELAGAVFIAGAALVALSPRPRLASASRQ